MPNAIFEPRSLDLNLMFQPNRLRRGIALPVWQGGYALYPSAVAKRMYSTTPRTAKLGD